MKTSTSGGLLQLPKCQKELDDRYGITRRRGRCGGAPCIGDSRLTVSSVIAFVVAEDGKTRLALRAYPQLKENQVQAVIAWALQTPMRWRR